MICSYVTTYYCDNNDVNAAYKCSLFYVDNASTNILQHDANNVFHHTQHTDHAQICNYITSYKSLKVKR
jgi:hypothetical protein